MAKKRTKGQTTIYRTLHRSSTFLIHDFWFARFRYDKRVHASYYYEVTCLKNDMLSARVHRRVRTTSGEGTVNPSGASDFTRWYW